MKKITLFILISGLVFTYSCKKDTKIEDVANLVNLNASYKCKINGASWNAVTRVTTKQGNTFLINGTGSIGNDVLNVTVLGITTGTYNLTTTMPVQTQMSATFANGTHADSLYTAYEGTVTLSSVDTTNKKISGSFSFKAKNLLMMEKVFTEGTFTNLIYQ